MNKTLKGIIGGTVLLAALGGAFAARATSSTTVET